MKTYIEQTFENRGLSFDKLFSFNRKLITYESFTNIKVLAERVLSEKHIVIMPDFDCDGISSGSLFFAGLKELGFNVSLYIPDVKRGYGINIDDIDDVIRDFDGVTAIITCDTGSTSSEAFKYAKSKGLNVYVTDHHLVPDELVCDISLNPYTSDLEFKDISGSEVVYFFLKYLSETYFKDKVSQIEKLVFLAGFGCISDTEPCVYDNRDIVKSTISFLNYFWDCIFNLGLGVKDIVDGCREYISVFEGLFDLLNVLYSTGKLKVIDETFIAFYIAPLFNAVKRLEEDMIKAFGVYIYGYGARELFDINEKRKLLTEQYYESKETINDFVYLSDAGPGMLGLIATRISSETGLPCFVLNKDMDGGYGGNGSGRSPVPFNLLSFIRKPVFSDVLEFSGGHEEAFGFCVNDVYIFASLFEKVFNMLLEKQRVKSKEDISKDLIKDDFEINSSTYNVSYAFDYLYSLEMLKPFGSEYFEPQVRVSLNPDDISDMRCIGSNKQHLMIQTFFGLKIFFWNRADLYKDVSEINEKFVFRGSLSLSEFNDEISVIFTGREVIKCV